MSDIVTLPTRAPAVVQNLDWSVAPKSPEVINSELRAEVGRLMENAEIAAVRHQLATAYTQMQLAGFNALLNYGINYLALPAYKDTSLLDRAQPMPLKEGAVLYMEYIDRIESDIAAAIRRKQMTVRMGGKSELIANITSTED